MATNSPKRLSPITTHWYNRSLSSVASDAMTFHSTTPPTSSVLDLEMQHRPQSSSTTLRLAVSRDTVSPTTTSIKMDRQDSGYDGTRASDEIQSSTKIIRPSYTTSSSTPSARPGMRRPKRGSPRTSISVPGRPNFYTRHTTNAVPATNSRPSSQGMYPAYQFFQFPTLEAPTDQETTTPTSAPAAAPESTATSPLIPPPTVHYWTSDSTRRLEYAAIDAASSGVRGFFTKLIPDCILPQSSRRPRFHEPDNENNSDAGSVRRYRLVIPEEKEPGMEAREQFTTTTPAPRKGFFRRWTSFARRTPSMV